MLHPGVEARRLVDIQQLAQETVRLDPSMDASIVANAPEVLLEAYDRKLQKDRDKALVLLPLLSGVELPWSGQDMFGSASPGAIASLFDPDAGDAELEGDSRGAACRERSSPFAALVEAPIPAGTSTKLVSSLGVAMSAIVRSTTDLEELSVTNHFQVWQVKIVQNGVVHHRRLALKLYDDRVRTPDRSIHNFAKPERRLPPMMAQEELLYDGRTLAYNEAAAYKKLAHLQGSLVPRSYGTYEFELPEGQGTCLGMLTEYIEHVSAGTRAYQILRDQGEEGIEDVKAMARQCRTNLETLVENKVIPRHINSSSLKYDRTSGNFIFIGFSSSKPDFKRNETARYLAVEPFLQAIVGMNYPELEKEEEICESLLAIFRS